MEYVVGAGAVLVHGWIQLGWLGYTPITYEYDFPSGGGPYSESSIVGRAWDPINDWFLHSSLNGIIWEPVKMEGPGTSKLRMLHAKPQPISYDPARDWNRYGSILARVGQARAVLSDNKAKQLRWEQEHGVFHGTTSGSLLPPSSTVYDDTTYGVEFLDTTVDAVHIVGPRYLGADGYLDLSSGTLDYTHVRIADFAEALRIRSQQDSPHWISAGPIWTRQRTLRDVSFEETLNSCQLKFTWFEEYFANVDPTDGYTEVEITSTITVTPTDHREFVAYGDTAAYTSGGYRVWTPHIWKQKIEFSNARSHGSVYPFTPFTNGTASSSIAAVAHVAAVVGAEGNEDDVKSSHVKHFREMDALVRRNMPDVYGAAYVAATSAIADHERIIDNNYVEAISEMGQLLDLIPDHSPLMKFLRLLPQGRLIAGTLQLADFAANTYLLHQYGLKNAVDDIRTFAEEYDRIAQRLRDRLRSDQEVRGKFTYTFPEDSELAGFVLTVRSKVVITFPRDGVTMALLPIHAYGALPTPSRIWATMTGSFIVDWFLNIGGRWKAGEAYVHAATAAVHYCVHSYTMTKKLSDEDLPKDMDDHHYRGASYKFYERVPSRYFPSPGESPYDWFKPVSSPPLLEAGALLWTRIRS